MKAIFWIIGLLLLLIVGIGVFVYFNSGTLIKSAIESYGPDYLGADVGVDSVAIRLTEGTGTVRGLRIGNPPGFEGPDAMRIGEVQLVLDPAQLSQDLVVIKQLRIDGAELAAIVQGAKKTNFQALMDRVSASSGDSSSTDSAGPKIIIDRFDFTNAKSSVTSDVLGEMRLNIPDIHLTGVGRETDGATAAEVVKQLLGPITQAVTRELMNRGLNVDELQDNVRKRVEESLGEKIGGGLKGLKERFGN